MLLLAPLSAMLPSGRGATAIQLGGPPSDCPTTGVGHFAAGGGVGGGMIIAVFTTIPLPGALASSSSTEEVKRNRVKQLTGRTTGTNSD
jgi:hypothetical protein